MINAAVYLLALVARRDVPTLLWLCVWCGLDIASDDVRETVARYIKPTHGPCPVCGSPDGRWVNHAKGFFYCFDCHAKGRATCC